MSGGRRKIRRATEEGLLEALASWYYGNDKRNITLADLYADWLNWKETPSNGDNIRRIRASWKAYYENEPLSADIIKKPLARVTSLELREWAESLLKKHYPVDKKKFSRMLMIVNQCCEYAADEDMERYKKNPTSAGLQILFLFETGLRIGECCGLKWSDVQGNRLYIRRQADNNGVKEWTKTISGYRDIPLTQKARHILDEVAEYNIVNRKKNRQKQ